MPFGFPIDDVTEVTNPLQQHRPQSFAIRILRTQNGAHVGPAAERLSPSINSNRFGSPLGLRGTSRQLRFKALARPRRLAGSGGARDFGSRSRRDSQTAP